MLKEKISRTADGLSFKKLNSRECDIIERAIKYIVGDNQELTTIKFCDGSYAMRLVATPEQSRRIQCKLNKIY